MSVTDCVLWLKLEISVHWRLQTSFALTRCLIKGAPPPYISRQMDPNNESLGEWASLFKPLYYKKFHWTSLSADPVCLNFEKWYWRKRSLGITHSQTVKEGLELGLYEGIWTCKWLYEPVFVLFVFLADKDSRNTWACCWTKKGKRRQRETRNVQNHRPSAFWGRGADPWRCQVWGSGGRRVACCQSSRSVIEHVMLIFRISLT